MYTINDIDIFIITHNRADYLDKMLESFSNQTIDISNIKIKVLSNDCIDNTEEVVQKYSFAQYIPTTGANGNYYKFTELVKKEYFILCHDDDIIHPQYFERMLNILNFVDEKPVLIGAGYSNFYNDEEITKKYNKSLCSKYYIVKDNKSFSRLVLSSFCNFCYASAIFKTEHYMKFDNIDLTKKYGRLADFFVMTEILKYGHAAILHDNKAYFHRLHKNSDTNSKTTLLSVNQFNNVINEFANLTNNFGGFSNERIWVMLEAYYKSVDNNMEYKEYLSHDTNIHLKKIHKINSYIDIYRKRHQDIYNYIKYFVLLKYHKKIKRRITRNCIEKIIKDVTYIQFY